MDLEIFREAIDEIKKKLGLKANFIPDYKWIEVFTERMAQRHLLNGREYSHFLLQSSKEMQELIERLVIHETWFFRERESFHYLILREKQRKFSPSPIKLLSFGCSTGEEPYSIAMALFESGLSRETFSIDAVDISQVALENAMKGMFRKHSFRGNGLSFRDRFFTKIEMDYQIHDTLKEAIRFYHANLLEDKLPFEPHSYQWVFCRNVLIYMNHTAQCDLFTLIKNYLSPEGILIVAPAETQIASLSGFVPVSVPKTYAFQLKQRNL